MSSKTDIPNSKISKPNTYLTVDCDGKIFLFKNFVYWSNTDIEFNLECEADSVEIIKGYRKHTTNTEILDTWKDIQKEKVCSNFDDMLTTFARRIINNERLK